MMYGRISLCITLDHFSHSLSKWISALVLDMEIDR